jgi:hypothetical protein
VQRRKGQGSCPAWTQSPRKAAWPDAKDSDYKEGPGDKPQSHSGDTATTMWVTERTQHPLPKPRPCVSHKESWPGPATMTNPPPPRSPRNRQSTPLNCNSHLAWLGRWLRRKRIVSGNPRCQQPFFLREIPIQDVTVQDFTCDGESAVGTGGARDPRDLTPLPHPAACMAPAAPPPIRHPLKTP